jgi:hypothetical protein
MNGYRGGAKLFRQLRRLRERSPGSRKKEHSRNGPQNVAPDDPDFTLNGRRESRGTRDHSGLGLA